MKEKALLIIFLCIVGAGACWFSYKHGPYPINLEFSNNEESPGWTPPNYSPSPSPQDQPMRPIPGWKPQQEQPPHQPRQQEQPPYQPG